MNLKQTLILLFVALLISITATSILYSFYYVVDVKETHVKLVVADFVGIDVNPINLTYGAVPPGGTGHRAFTVRNIYNMPVQVTVQISGDVARFVRFSNTSFRLDKGTQEQVQSSGIVPENTVNGTYYGKLRIVITRAW
ncbi:MAG: hypothetical protein V1837_03110 [Candidatus Woesearchaeota archaeon]